jgi:hypothetical protein
MSLLAAQGFKLTVLLDLVHDGLARARTETVTAPGRRTEIVCLRITAAGRRAIGAQSPRAPPREPSP